jgi:hypothetical protein
MSFCNFESPRGNFTCRINSMSVLADFSHKPIRSAVNRSEHPLSLMQQRKSPMRERIVRQFIDDRAAAAARQACQRPYLCYDSRVM